MHHRLGGKALRFNRVEGSPVPLVINTFGSYRRMEIALGCEDGGFEQLAAKIEHLVKPQPPVGLIDKMKKGLELAKVASFAPKVVRTGLCQQVVHTGDAIDLFSLPIIKCWPHDGNPRQFGYPFDLQLPGEGRYITFGGVYTIHPDDAGKPEGAPRPSRNIGMYRLQLLDKKREPRSLHELAAARYLTRDQARELTQRVLSFATADETRVSVGSGSQGNTRFAVNQISTAGDNYNTSVTIRSVVGKRAGQSTTNALDDASLRRAVDTAERLAKLSPEDPEYMLSLICLGLRPTIDR
jgi:hypothetical protein